MRASRAAYLHAVERPREHAEWIRGGTPAIDIMLAMLMAEDGHP